MSLTKTIKKIRQELDVVALDMEGLDRQKMKDFIHRRRTWIKGIRNCIRLIDSILNFKKNK